MRASFPSTILALALLAGAARAEFTPVYHPELNVGRTAGAVEIDGVLDDPGWRGAARAGDFAEHSPGDQVRPPVETEAWIAHDDDHVYVAFVCRDDPATIRASYCPRDRIFDDDNVLFCVDTFGDGATAYEFAVNPYGIQGDLRYSSASGEDWRYDMIYRSAARITDEGWVVEMAIPFSSLRFPDTETQVWRADFWRNRPRDVRYQMSWAAYDRGESCWPCQWGTLRGIRGVEPGGKLEVLPAFVAHQSAERGDDGRFENGDVGGEPSASLKYALSSDAVVEATVNPDFSQVESDAAQIDVNTNYALFYPEKRPFFQEGADLFDTWFSTVYTRSINDPAAAAKATGRSGGTSYALLTARDEHSPIILPFEERSRLVLNGRSWSNLLRVKHDLGEQTHVGVIATDRRYDGGGAGTTAGVDARWRFDRSHQVEVQYMRSFTDEPDDSLMTADFGDARFDGGRRTAAFDGESFGGHALYAALERHAEHWDFDLEYWDRSPGYRADNGYETHNDRRTAEASTGYLFRLDDSSLFEWIMPSVLATRSWTHRDAVKEERIQAQLEFRLRWAQTSTHSRWWAGAEVFDGVRYEGLRQWHTCLHSRPSDRLAWGGSANYGHRIVYRKGVVGRQSDYSLWVDLKPLDRLLIEPRLTYSESREMRGDRFWFKGYVARCRLTLQITRELSSRLVVQYDDFAKRWEADPLLTYQIDPFSIFYVGSTRDYGLVSPGSDPDESWRLTHRQYFLKLQYLFRI